VAIEEYLPNARLAHKRLSPFVSGKFDLVLNRNSGFHPSEVTRILTSGGTFLTNQVHGLTLSDLLALFGASPQWPDATSEKYIPLQEQIENCGELTFEDRLYLVEVRK